MQCLTLIRFLTLVCLAVGVVNVGRAAEQNPEAIAKVKAGQLTEAKVSWWGCDNVDATKNLQAALDSGARRVIVDDVRRPWIVTTITVPSNIEIVFEKGVTVQAKRGAFRGSNDCLFRIANRQNVSLIGNGATLRMWRDDYDRAPYKKAEWRHVLSITSSSDITVSGLTLAESGGDGIYLGTAKRGVTNRNIHIKDVVCDRNYRQGISVITAENLLIEDTILSNTGGTSPQAGIDFEPNNASERLVNCVMRNCVAKGNAGGGYLFYLPNLTGKSAPLSIRMDRCVAEGPKQVPFRFYLARPNPSGPVQGSVLLDRCTLFGDVAPVATLNNKPASGARVTFRQCKMVCTQTDKPSVPVLLFQAAGELQLDVGGIVLDQCELESAVVRPAAKFDDRTGEVALVDVTGTFRMRAGGTERSVLLSPEWAETIRIGKRYERFPDYPIDARRLVPIDPHWKPKSNDVRPYTLRHAGEFGIFAAKGDHVSFTLQLLQVGKYHVKNVTPIVRIPSGKQIKPGTVVFEQDQPLSFDAPDTGLYLLSFDCGANKLRMTACSNPFAVLGDHRAIQFISTVGDFYFFVPAGTKRFGVKVFGEGGEAVRATLFDPSGRRVWDKPTVTSPEQFVASPSPLQQDQVWRIRFSRPIDAPMEDFRVRLQGIPPLLSCHPKMVFKLKKRLQED